MARTQSGELLNTLQKGFKYIEEGVVRRASSRGCFSEINLGSDKLGRKYEDRNAKLCSIISEIARGMALFSTDIDTLGDAYEYLIGQFAAGSGKKAGEFYTPQQISSILVRHRHARQPGAKDRQAEAAGKRLRFRLRVGVAAAERAPPNGSRAGSGRSMGRSRTSRPTTWRA